MSGVTVPTMMTSTSLGADAARGEAFFCGLSADVAHAFARRELVPLADPGALHDPLVAGFYHFFEVLIGDHIGRNVGSERRNLGAPAHDGANGQAQCISPCGAHTGGGPARCFRCQAIRDGRWRTQKVKRSRRPKKYRVTYCARTSPLPLLPSGPGGVGGITSRRARHWLILSLRCR